jgi:hypothetical protein
MPDYLNMQNPYSDVRPRTRKEESIIQQIEQDNLKAHAFNESKKHEKAINGPLKRYCPLDEAPLKPIKAKPIEGLPEISKPRYRCTLCKSVFEGFGINLFHETKKNLKAIVFEFDGTV